MKRDRNAFEKALRRHMSLFGSPSANQVEASRARVRERLRARADVPGIAEPSRRRHIWRAALPIAATLAIATLIVIAPKAAEQSIFKPYMLLRILTAFTKGMADTGIPIPPAGPFRDVRIPDAAQAAAVVAGVPDFEEASIKPCDPNNLPEQPDGGRGGGANSVQLTPGRLRALCVTAATLVRIAYGYGPMQFEFNRRAAGPATMTFGLVYGVGEEDGQRVRGGADWVRSERYTIEGVSPRGASPEARALSGPMLQRLLERRFQLKAHVEAEPAPAYALAVVKGGLKIKPVMPGDCHHLEGREGQPMFYGYPANVLTPPHTVAEVRAGAKPSCGIWGGRNGPNDVVIGGDIPLEALAFRIGRPAGRVRILDRTGITAHFNFVLEFLLDENDRIGGLPDRGAELDTPPAANIFTALEEQLGLKLEKAQTSRDFIVIDRIERPSPN